MGRISRMKLLGILCFVILSILFILSPLFTMKKAEVDRKEDKNSRRFVGETG